ncbi:MAG: FprA family A-type flavoprotein [Alphaproteobacteria bacterium]
MQCTTLYSRENHRWMTFGQDPDKPGNVIDTNQLVVADGDTAMLLDPGGAEIFPQMIAGLTRKVQVDHVRHIFVSHQDPDVCSSLPLWRKVCPSDVKVYVPSIWTGFVAHFDPNTRVTAIPDQGMEVSVGRVRLRILPAHYLHSSGNFHVYDPAARVLFTGDVGGALMPSGGRGDVFVNRFDHHVQYMETFHRRWMGSPAARDAWVAMVSRLDIDILAPQHGLMFKGDDVKRFIQWFGSLDIGTGVSAFAQA